VAGGVANEVVPGAGELFGVEVEVGVEGGILGVLVAGR
jgi:hypothetical protein